MIYANDPSELLTLAQTLDMTGLEFMQGIFEGRHPAPPIAKTMNYQLHDVSDGRIVFRGAPLFEHCNPMGTVHGGWYGTLLDSSLACCVMTKLPKGRVYTTLEYKVNILRSIPIGMEIDCIAEAQHVGRSTGVANGEIRGVDDGKLYATGSTTCIIMSP